MPKFTIAIDIGPEQVKVLKMARVKGEVVLEAVEIQKLPTSSKGTPVWDTEIRHAIKEAYLGLKTNLRRVLCLTPGSATLMKCVKFPPVSRYKIDKLIEYEIPQHIPGDGKGQVVGYQTLRCKDGYNLLMAISREDEVRSRINLIEETGLKVETLGTSVYSIINAYLFNYDVKEGLIALLNIGADQTDFVILEDGIPLYVRMIPIGGDLVTREVAREFRINENEAKNLKEEKGRILAEESGNTEEERLSMAIKKALNSILEEIYNSIRFFRKDSQVKDADIKKLYIAGGTSLIAGIDNYIHEHIGIEVELLNPLKRLKVNPELEKVRTIGQVLAVGIGLGLRGLDAGHLNIDLVPDEVKKERDARHKAKYTVPSWLLVCTILLTPIIERAFSLKYNKMKLNKVNKELARYETYLPDIVALRGEINDIEGKINVLEGLIDKNTVYPEQLSILSKLTPRDIYFNSFLVKLKHEKGIEYLALNGSSSSYELIENFSTNIESSNYFDHVKITQVKDKSIGESIGKELDFMAYLIPKERIR